MVLFNKPDLTKEDSAIKVVSIISVEIIGSQSCTGHKAMLFCQRSCDYI